MSRLIFISNGCKFDLTYSDDIMLDRDNNLGLVREKHTIEGDCTKDKPKSPFRQVFDENKSLKVAKIT